jgi:hypothetical protein
MALATSQRPPCFIMDKYRAIESPPLEWAHRINFQVEYGRFCWPVNPWHGQIHRRGWTDEM